MESKSIEFPFENTKYVNMANIISPSDNIIIFTMEWKKSTKSVLHANIWVMSFINNNSNNNNVLLWLMAKNLHSLIFGRCQFKQKSTNTVVIPFEEKPIFRTQRMQRMQCYDILLNATYLLLFIHQLLIWAQIRCGHHKMKLEQYHLRITSIVQRNQEIIYVYTHR